MVCGGVCVCVVQDALPCMSEPDYSGHYVFCVLLHVFS